MFLSKEQLSKVTYLALKYFCTSLDKSKEAKKYLLNRINAQTVKAYYVGYAPKHGLIDYLNKHNVDVRAATAVDLIGINEDDTAYETFTNRIMFPIILNQRVLGFGGRTLINHSIKYLNSKKSPLYDKGSTLYLLDKAKKSIYKEGWAVLVEGYFDVLSLVTHGIHNVVASCGTAFTESQARLLRRWVNEVYICYDGDEAGKEAAKNAKKILNKYDIYGGTLTLPKEYDPDEFVNEFGEDAFLALKK
jgi:DNA primase